MYSLVLTLHSWLRWAALLLGIVATFASMTDRSDARQSPGQRWGQLFLMALDTQMLLGLLLYFVLSPFTAEAFKDFGAAMRNPLLRFWAVEHVSKMMVAVILAHVGRVLGARARTPQAKRVRQSLCFGLATILIIVAVPWPGRANGRPLFRV
jgi:hypothetical protein